MSRWTIVLVAAALSFAVKFGGYLIPRRWVEHERVMRVTDLVPVALLAALVVVQSLVDRHGDLAIDARVAAVAAAVVALVLRAPFLAVIVIAAAVAAGLRALGVG